MGKRKPATPEQQPDQELAQYIDDRNQKLLALVSKIMPVIKNAVETEGLGSVDVAEALGLCAASTLVAITPPQYYQKVQEESINVANETMKALRARKIGMGTSVTSQLVGQAKVLSYISGYAAHDIYHRMKEKDANDTTISGNQPTD